MFLTQLNLAHISLAAGPDLTSAALELEKGKKGGGDLVEPPEEPADEPSPEPPAKADPVEPATVEAEKVSFSAFRLQSRFAGGTSKIHTIKPSQTLATPPKWQEASTKIPGIRGLALDWYYRADDIANLGFTGGYSGYEANVTSDGWQQQTDVHQLDLGFALYIPPLLGPEALPANCESWVCSAIKAPLHPWKGPIKFRLGGARIHTEFSYLQTHTTVTRSDGGEESLRQATLSTPLFNGGIEVIFGEVEFWNRVRLQAGMQWDFALQARSWPRGGMVHTTESGVPTAAVQFDY